MHPYILGTDIGTGSTKTLAVDFSGKVLCTSQGYYDIQSPEPGYSEQEPAGIFNAFRESIKETVSKMDGPPAAISLSSAMHGLMAVDESCRPLTKLILWSDSRSSTIAERLKNLPEGKSIYEATGTPIHSMSPLCKIIWLRENASELFARAWKFISIKEYIWFQLFQKFEIDYSLASATGLFHIEHLAWNTESLALAGITGQKLSKPVPTDFIRTDMEEKMAAILQVPASTPFCIGASDGCLANLGTNSLKSGTAAITIGTSGAVRIARTKPLCNYSTMGFNYLLDEATFICGGPVNNGGSVVQWLLKSFLSREPVKDDDYHKLFADIEMVPAGSKGLLFLPYINGERAPMWDEESCGVFFGVKSYHSQAYFLRAALEGVCFALQEVLLSIEDPAHPIQQVNASGGFVQSPVWVQLLANITGKKISVLQTEDASATGAAWLGLKALHIIPDYSSLQQEKGMDVHPQKEAVKVYKKAAAIFKTLYPSLKTSMHLLRNSGYEE